MASMRIPNGIRKESMRIPNASRAGALYATQRYATPLHDVGHFCIPNPVPRDLRAPALTSDPRSAAMQNAGDGGGGW